MEIKKGCIVKINPYKRAQYINSMRYYGIELIRNTFQGTGVVTSVFGSYAEIDHFYNVPVSVLEIIK